LSSVQAIVDDILCKRRDLSREEILALIDEKKKEGRGLLSDEGAARLVAEELLIQTLGTELGRMRVKDLVSGLNDVTVSGRILLAWPPQGFQRRDGMRGRVMRLVLIDKTGRVNCALWDRHVDFVSRAGKLQGRIIRIGHAYTRQGLAGEPELHAGDRSSIEIDPQDMPTTDFSEFKDVFTPLSKLTGELNQVNAVGVVQVDPRFYSFTKEDRIGSVLRTLLADDSGTIPVVAWNERAEELRELKKGQVLQILNSRVRFDNNGRPELHVESRGQVEILQSPPDYLKTPVQRKHKIASLTPQSGAVDLAVSVIAKGEPREVTRATGEAVKVSTLIVADETGIASLSLWDDKAEIVNQLPEQALIEVRGVSVRERLGEVRLSLGRTGELQVLQSKSEIRPRAAKLDSLETSRGLLIIEGVVGDEPVIRQVATERGETVSVASFTIRDDVGSARVTLWREQANSAITLRTGAKLRITGLRVRPGLGGQLELSSIALTRLEPLEQHDVARPAWQDIRHVIALEPGLTTWIKGVVLDLVGEQKLVALCETCSSELGVLEGDFVCQNCKAHRTGDIGLYGRLRIDDGTGVVDVILSSEDPSRFIAVDIQIARGHMLKEGRTSINLERVAFSNLLGKEIEVYGTTEKSEDKAKYEFKARKILLVGTL